MEIFLTLVFGGFVALIYFVVKTNKENNNLLVKTLESFKTLKDFKPTKEFKAKFRPSIIALDEEKREFAIIDIKYMGIVSINQTTPTTTRLSFKDILSSELVMDEEVVSKKSTGGTIGGAVAGAVLAGGVGALIGGLSSSSTSKAKIRNIDLRITTKNISKPVVTFRFFDCTMDTQRYKNELPLSDFRCKQAFDTAKEWHSIISIVIDQENNL